MRKGNIYKFKADVLSKNPAFSKNLLTCVSFFIDESDNSTKIILRDGFIQDLFIEDINNLEEVELNFNDKLLSALLDISESMRVLAQNSEPAHEHVGCEHDNDDPDHFETNKKKEDDEDFH